MSSSGFRGLVSKKSIDFEIEVSGFNVPIGVWSLMSYSGFRARI